MQRMAIFSETEAIIKSDSRKIRYRNDSNVSHGQWLGLGFLKSPEVSSLSWHALYIMYIIITNDIYMIWPRSQTYY